MTFETPDQTKTEGAGTTNTKFSQSGDQLAAVGIEAFDPPVNSQLQSRMEP